MRLRGSARWDVWPGVDVQCEDRLADVDHLPAVLGRGQDEHAAGGQLRVGYDLADGACGTKRTAQTALPWPAIGLQPHTSLSAFTICRPRPDSPAPPEAFSTGGAQPGSSTAQITSPVRRRSRRPRFSWPGRQSPSGRALCVTAFAASSPTIISASSASDGRPQSRNVSRVRRRAAAVERWSLLSWQPTTGGESHQSAGNRTMRRRPDLWSWGADELSGRQVVGPGPLRGSNCVDCRKLIAAPAPSSYGPSRLRLGVFGWADGLLPYSVT